MNNRDGIKKIKIKELGQYFTPKFVAKFMVSLISKPREALILDPCAGTGVFLSALVEEGFKNVVGYEIDASLPNYSPVKINYQDFLKVEPKEKYDVIIGNPPYVRWKNIPKSWKEEFRKSQYWQTIMNGLSDLTYAFIYHCINMLKKGGELIFITPIFWTETVHGAKLRNYLAERGHLEVLINFNEMRIFEGVSSTIIIFKYVKLKSDKPIKIINLHTKERLTPQHLERVKVLLNRLDKGEKYILNGIFEAFLHRQFRDGESWRPIPEIKLKENTLFNLQCESLYYFRKLTPLGCIAEIGNGMVSGLDRAFQLNNNIIHNLTKEERKYIIYVFKANTLDRFYPIKSPVPYIYVNDIEDEEQFKEKFPHFYEKLVQHKDSLLRRYNYGRDIPWWHWVFPRNKHLFEKYDEKILVPSKERYDTRGYFRFAYVRGLYYATQDVTVICPKKEFREGAKYLLALLNSEPYQEYILYKGFTRGGVYDFSEKPLASIPILRIDWSSNDEKKLYNEILFIVNEILENQSWKSYIDELNATVSKLIKIKVITS